MGIAHKTRKGTTDICHEGKRELLGIGGCKWALNGKKQKVKGRRTQTDYAWGYKETD